MSRKYRRPPVDMEVLIASQEVIEITDDMELLDEEIVAEVLESIEQNDLYMRRVAHTLKMRNPKLENIAIMRLDGHTKIVLLFSDKHGVVVGTRRQTHNMIRNLLREAA